MDRARFQCRTRRVMSMFNQRFRRAKAVFTVFQYTSPDWNTTRARAIQQQINHFHVEHKMAEDSFDIQFATPA